MLPHQTVARTLRARPKAPPVDDLLQVLADLVAIDSTSARSNLPVLDLVEALVEPYASGVWRLPAEADEADGTGGEVAKANLVVRVGPDAPGGVVLSGHTDCVPVEGQVWTSDPFALRRDGDTVVGRGALDMKGFIAACLDAVPDMAAADLTAPIWLALSHDEEIGAVGAVALAPAMARIGATPDAVIIGEPTSMGIINSHKGVMGVTMTVRGRSAHSSRPDIAASASVAVARIAARVIEEGEAAVAAMTDDAFHPPHTTYNIGQLHGGTAINIIPDEATIVWEYRGLPGMDGTEIADRVVAYARDLVADLQADVPEADLDVVIRPMPALHAEPDGVAEGLVRTLTGNTAPAQTAPFGTDGPRFQSQGWSTVLCGPGSIDVAHRPDEWIALDQLAACRTMIGRLIEHGSRPRGQ